MHGAGRLVADGARRCRRALALAAWLGLLAGTAVPAAVIDEIAIQPRGAFPVDREMVLLHTRLRAGMELDRQRVSRDVRALLDSGRFAYVAAELLPLDAQAGRVRLVYVIEGKWKLAAPVRIKGARHHRSSTLREWGGIQPGDGLSEADAAVVAARVRDRLRQRRYTRAEVIPHIEPDPNDATLARLRLEVSEGPRLRVTGVVFSGNTVFPDAELRRAMSWPTRMNPINWFRRHPYRPEMFDLAADQVRDHYLKAGYLDVRVGPAVVVETAPGRLRARLPVEEGPRYRLGQADIEGVMLFEPDAMRDALAWTPGATAGMDRIEAAAQRIHAAYAAEGYRGTRVVPDLLRQTDAPVVDLRFRVREGVKTHLHLVHIRGNQVTRDKVIRRELAVVPGDLYNEVLIRRSENRLRGLGYFAHVASYPELREPGRADLVFEVEEKATGQLMLGTGFSSIENIFGFVEVSQGNFDLFNWPRFRGGGQKLNLRAQLGAKSRDYSLSFTEPWFLNRRLSLGFDAYAMERRYRDYADERVGGAVRLGVPLRGPQRLEWVYRLERMVIKDVADRAEYTGADGAPFFFSLDGRRLKSMLGVALVRDTLDDAMIPSRGHRLRLGVNGAGGPFGGDIDVYGLESRAVIYLPLWFRHVAVLHARLDVVEAYGNTAAVPLQERLFAGGPRTVRGFRYRDVGPKAVRIAADGSATYRPQGGNTLAVAGAEYSVPTPAGIRLAGFVDAGNVWFDAYDLDSNVAVSAGFGLRFDIPGFPIRLDYAWPLRRDDPHSRTQRFSFWIGYGF